MKDLIEVTLPDGEQIWALVEVVGPRDVGAKAMSIKGFAEILRGVAMNARAAIAEIAPQETSLEFGVNLALGKDGLIAALAGVEAEASLKVTLTWHSKTVA